MFKFDKSMLNKFSTHTFQGSSIAWIDYILANRFFGNKKLLNYDIVIGKVADASAIPIMTSYVSKFDTKGTDSDKRRLIDNLKPNVLTDQYCFKTARAIKFLNDIGFYKKEV